MSKARSPAGRGGRRKAKPRGGKTQNRPVPGYAGKLDQSPGHSGKGSQGVPELRPATFSLGAAALAQAPPDTGTEVAFGGRSNAGKSSALNVLTGQSSLARVSKTPGRTQQINFFEIDESARLVDLPGYGFARAPVAAKAAWSSLVETYLQRRASLQGVVIIMDSRRPLMDSDRQMVEWANAVELPFHVVLTKADKLSRNQGARSLQFTRRELAACSNPELHSAQLFSALKKEGVEELGRVVSGWLWPTANADD